MILSKAGYSTQNPCRDHFECYQDVTPAESDHLENEAEVWQRVAAISEREDDFCSGVPFFYVSDSTGGFSQRIASVDHRG